MIVTNNKKFYNDFLEFRNICFSLKKPRFIHEDIGWNYRLTNLQAAIGCAQLKKLPLFIKKKRMIGKLYSKNLNNIDEIQLPLEIFKKSKNIYWVYSLLIKNKYITALNLSKKLKIKKIETRPFFCPMHMQPIIKKLKLINKNEKFPCF